MSQTESISRGPAAEIKSYVDRIERVEGERKDLASDVRDIYVEAKGRGYNPKALRKVIVQRGQKTDAELEADIEQYRAALGMAGATYRSVAEDLGIPRSTLHRLVPKTSRGTRPMTAEDLGSFDIGNPDDAREMVADDLGDPLLITNPFRAKVKGIASKIKSASDYDAFKRSVQITPDDDPGPIPAFLDRRARA